MDDRDGRCNKQSEIEIESEIKIGIKIKGSFACRRPEGRLLAQPPLWTPQGRKARCWRRSQLERKFATRCARWRWRLEGGTLARAGRSLAFEQQSGVSDADGIDARPLSRQARAVGLGAASVSNTRKRSTNSGSLALRAVGPKPARSGLGTFDSAFGPF